MRGLLLGALLAVVVTTPVQATTSYLPEPAAYLPGGTGYLPASLGPEGRGPWVAELQRRLTAAGFYRGEIDGEYHTATLEAVYAFQKTHGLTRDGIFLAEHWPMLDLSVQLLRSETADRVEIDLERQVMFLVEDQRVASILPISSASGEAYAGSSGRVVRSSTPEGAFRFYRHIDGWRISYLGGLYRPYYFRGGYAVHGSYSVPPYPASHGCIRVTIDDMDFLVTKLDLGMPVYLYGLGTERRLVVPPVTPTKVTSAAFQ